jgi:hypothetical protein
MISVPWFSLAFAIGMLAVYVTNPPPTVIVKFPSPYNVGKVTYHDKADNCYRYVAEEVKCPSDPAMIKPQPILEDFRQRQRKKLS